MKQTTPISRRSLLATTLLVCGLVGCQALGQGVPNIGRPSDAAAAENVPEAPVVKLVTTAGDITIQLDGKKAPQSTANFLKYVEEGYYANTIFHRVMKDFMIQGGGVDANTGREKRDRFPPVKNEGGNGLKNETYTVAMARTNDPHSATSQFFINTADNAFLDRANARDGYGYTVFGRVIEGQDVVRAIEAGRTKTSQTGEPSAPVEPVVIKEAKLVEQK